MLLQRTVTRRRIRLGFTLIELLVVIAIIAILAAILFPVFAQARDAARKATCLSNMKQVGLGMGMYVQDYDSIWPGQASDGFPLDKTGLAGASPFNYKDRILPYTKNEQIWLCPSNIPNGTLGVQPPNIGYHMNGNLITANGLAEAAIAAPANLLAMRESGKGYVFNRGYLRPYRGNCDDVIQYEAGSPQNYMPHMQGYNILFADSHTKWYKSGQTLQLAMFPSDTGRSTQVDHPGATLCPAN